jgi:hypothetical protein
VADHRIGTTGIAVTKSGEKLARTLLVDVTVGTGPPVGMPP